VERLGGKRLAGFHPVVPDNGYINFLAAINKRCNYYDAGLASKHVIRSSIKLINLISADMLPEFHWSEDLFERWASRFGDEKRARMESALKDLSPTTLAQYSGKDLMVKVEALLVTHKPNWAPRVIYKGSDLYNVVSGPMYWELMHRLDAAAEASDSPHKVKFAYGRTPEQYVPFLEAGSGDYLESDFSANDKKQCQDVKRLEIMLMRRLGCPEWFVRLEQRSNSYRVGNFRHGFQADLDFQLATGATDTTFRNCFWNWCILYSFLLREKAPSSRSTILGDDIVARIPGLKRMAAKRYARMAEDARMEAKVSRHGLLLDCSFLSKVFVPLDSGHHSMMPLPGKALGRFNTRANRNDAVTDNCYFAAKSIGYAYEFRFCPSLRDIFLDRFLHHAPLVEAEKHKFRFLDSAMSWGAKQAGLTLKNVRDKLIVVSDFIIERGDLLEFVWYRYGVTVDEFITLFESIVLDTSFDDIDSPLVELLAKDFV